MDENINKELITPPVFETAESLIVESVRGGLCPNLADRALPVSLPVTIEDNCLSTVEARLAEEILVLTTALQKFGVFSKGVSEELPDSAEFGKLVTGLLSLLCFQFSDSLLKDMDSPILLSDGSEHLLKLGLSLNDAFREINLEGRKFLAVALIDQ